jgi:hypothetical protein
VSDEIEVGEKSRLKYWTYWDCPTKLQGHPVNPVGHSKPWVAGERRVPLDNVSARRWSMSRSLVSLDFLRGKIMKGGGTLKKTVK